MTSSSLNDLKNHLGSLENQNQKTSRNQSFGTRLIGGIVLPKLVGSVTETIEYTSPQIVKAKRMSSIHRRVLRRKGKPMNKTIMTVQGS
jgi:hypothetical protein